MIEFLLCGVESCMLHDVDAGNSWLEDDADPVAMTCTEPTAMHFQRLAAAACRKRRAHYLEQGRIHNDRKAKGLCRCCVVVDIFIAALLILPGSSSRVFFL